ncbi:MAG: signal peptidase II [FCB group bacterium]|jgi:signal peptidase II
MSNKKNNIYWFYLAAATLIILDQATKLIVKGFDFGFIKHAGMRFGECINIVGTFIQFIYVENSGMAFGITFGSGKLFLSIFSIIAGGGLIYYLYKINSFSIWIKLGITLILAGALGNAVDRVFYGVFFHEAPLFFGRVVDFIQVDIPDINIGPFHYTHWPIFNVADSCVSCGVILLLIFHKKIPTFAQVFKPREQIANSPVSENELSTFNKSE